MDSIKVTDDIPFNGANKSLALSADNDDGQFLLMDTPKTNSPEYIVLNEQKQKEIPIGAYYDLYKENPSNENFQQVIKALKPTINYALASNKGLGNPYVETKANVLAARAIKSFDPAFNVSLPTYVTTQLRKLIRVARDANNPVKIPERLIGEIADLNEREREFKEKFGHDPDATELADFSGYSEKKIGEIRNKALKQMSEGQYFSGSGSSDSGPASAEEGEGSSADFTDEALRYVHSDLSHRDKQILEWSTGYAGSDILSPAEISNKLGISQSQVSRISASLAAKIYDMINALNKAYAK